MSDTSNWWDSYRKRVESEALKLPNTPSEIDQNIMWLKAFIIEKLVTEDLPGTNLFVGKSEDGTFGFKETTVNAMLWHAFEAGKRCDAEKHTRDTKHMRETIDKMITVLDNYLPDNY